MPVLSRASGGNCYNRTYPGVGASPVLEITRCCSFLRKGNAFAVCKGGGACYCEVRGLEDASTDLRLALNVTPAIAVACGLVGIGGAVGVLKRKRDCVPRHPGRPTTPGRGPC